MATLHVLSGDAAPRLRTVAAGLVWSDDPKIDIDDARQWDALDLGPGMYRLYSLAGAPTSPIMGCPK